MSGVCICIKSCIETINGGYLFRKGESYRYEVISHYISPDIWSVKAMKGDVVQFYEEVSNYPLYEHFVDLQQVRDIKLNELL